MDLGPKAEMREIRTSGLMSGIWKRNGLIVTAPDLDSTKSSEICGRCRLLASEIESWLHHLAFSPQSINNYRAIVHASSDEFFKSFSLYKLHRVEVILSGCP